MACFSRIARVITVVVVVETLTGGRLGLSGCRITVNITFAVCFTFYAISAVIGSCVSVFASILSTFVYLGFVMFCFTNGSLVTSGTLALGGACSVLGIPYGRIDIVLLVLTVRSLVLPPFFTGCSCEFFAGSLVLNFRRPFCLTVIYLAIVYILTLGVECSRGGLGCVFVVATMAVLAFHSGRVTTILVVLLLCLLFIGCGFRNGTLVLTPITNLTVCFSSSRFSGCFAIRSCTPVELGLVRSNIGVTGRRFPFNSKFTAFNAAISCRCGSPFCRDLNCCSGLCVSRRIITSTF